MEVFGTPLSISPRWNSAFLPIGTHLAPRTTCARVARYRLNMEAKDGSMGFDFWGIYDEVRNNNYIEYTLGDGRKVTINFTATGNTTKITEKLRPGEHQPARNAAGWLAGDP